MLYVDSNGTATAERDQECAAGVGEIEREPLIARSRYFRLSVNTFCDGYPTGIRSQSISDENSQACPSDSEVISHLTNSAAGSLCLLTSAEQ